MSGKAPAAAEVPSEARTADMTNPDGHSTDVRVRCHRSRLANGRIALAVAICTVTLGLAVLAIGGVDPAMGEHVGDAPAVVPHELVGQEGGAIRAIRPVGDVLWMGLGPRLVAVDASDPSAPRIVGRSPVLAGSVQDLAIGDVGPNGAGSRADVAWALLAGGVVAGVDISDPSRPVPLGTANALAACVGIAAVGDHVWVVTEDGDLLGYDVGDPRAPSASGRLDGVVQGYWLRRVGAIPGHVVLAVSGGSPGGPPLHVLDVRDAAHPVLVSTTTVGDSTSYVRDMFVDGNTAWLTALDPEALVGFDLSVPATPVLLSHFEHQSYWARWLTVRDGLAYLTGGDFGHNYFVTTVVDVRDPVSPTVVAAQPLPRTSDPTGAAVAANDTYWYGTIDGHLFARDASDPAAGMPHLADLQSIGVARALAIDGAIGLVRSGEAVLTLDLARAAAPRALTTTLVHYYPTTVALTGTTGYVVTYGQMDVLYGELHILDVDDPSEPEVVASAEVSDPWSLALQGPILALGCGYGDDAGVWLLDVSQPRVPVRSGTIRVAGGVQSVAMDGRSLYAASPGPWSPETVRPELIVADVADASSPRVQARLRLAGQAHDWWELALAAHGDFAYVMATRYNDDGSWWDSTLRPIDASDPRQPVDLGGLRLPAAPAEVVFAHGYLLLPGDGGVAVIDVRDAHVPKPIGSLPTGGDAAAGVAVQDGLAYVRALEGGLYVFAPRLEGWPPAQLPPTATITATGTTAAPTLTPTTPTPTPTPTPGTESTATSTANAPTPSASATPTNEATSPTAVAGARVFLPSVHARGGAPVPSPGSAATPRAASPAATRIPASAPMPTATAGTPPRPGTLTPKYTPGVDIPAFLAAAGDVSAPDMGGDVFRTDAAGQSSALDAI